MLVIPADVTEPVRREGWNETIEAFQAIVGGFVEIVVLPDAALFVNEEGLREGLPENPRADEICRVLGGMELTSIMGDALVIGYDELKDTYSDCPEALAVLAEGLPKHA